AAELSRVTGSVLVACSTAAGGRASDLQTRLRSLDAKGGGRTLFIWIGYNITNTDRTVGIIPR
ncbi:MAG: hypothetical protein LLG40_04725, partial [Deltaproteobacteria bacterium]|nr:hypothetical protein [Deltaproteobacteria bacterium]